MQYDQYNLYSLNVCKNKMDVVDDYVRVLNLVKSYDEAMNFINKEFGDIEERKLIEYEDLQKQVEIKIKENAVEFFAAKNWRQYFGRGWRKPETNPES